MKKLLFLFVVAAISMGSMSVYAQSGGIKVGMNFANMAIEPSSLDEETRKLLFSPRFGFIFEMPVYEGVFFQTGINTSAKGFKWEGTRMLETGYSNGHPTYTEYESVEYNLIWYVDLPIQFGYKFDLGAVKPFVMTGPVFNYGVYTTNLYKANGEYDNDHLTIGTADTDDYLPFDFNWNIEGGVQWSRLQFTLFYSHGFSNVLNIPDGATGDYADASMKNRVFGFNIAVLFGNQGNDSRRR